MLTTKTSVILVPELIGSSEVQSTNIGLETRHLTYTLDPLVKLKSRVLWKF